jgi:hypothetical protein
VTDFAYDGSKIGAASTGCWLCSVIEEGVGKGVKLGHGYAEVGENDFQGNRGVFFQRVQTGLNGRAVVV